MDCKPTRQFALGIDEEYGTHGCRLAFTGLDHAVKVRHLHRHVVDDREFDLDILHAPVFDLLTDRTQPCDMAVAAVDRQSDQFAVQSPEFGRTGTEREHLGGADRRKVGGVAEQDHPFALVVGGKADLSPCCHRFECRDGFPQARQLLFVLFHNPKY